MATLYVDPDGSDTSPYETVAKAATSLHTAINACSTGDTIILTNRTDHTNTGSATSPATCTIQNEDGDGDYRKVAFATWTANTGIKCDQDVTIQARGITFNGASFTGAPNGVFYTDVSKTGSRLVLDSCRITGVDHSGSSTKGGVFRLVGTDNTNSLELRDCVIDDNLGMTTVGGCLARTQAWNVDISGLTWSNNGDASTNKSGHFLIEANIDNVTVDIARSSFVGNTAGGTTLNDGGALYLFSNGNQLDITLTECLFQDCDAKKGGGVWIGRDVEALVRDCQFIDCEATTYGGGGIGKGAPGVPTFDTKLDLVNCLFLRCTQTGVDATAGGGAIRVDNGRYARIFNCTFIDCTAAGGEGGDSIYVQDHNASGTASKTILRNSVFVGTGAATHIVGGGNDGFDAITEIMTPNGASDISDTGATTANNLTGDPGVIGPEYQTHYASEAFGQGRIVTGIHNVYAPAGGAWALPTPSIGIDDGGLSLQQRRRRLIRKRRAA